MKFLVLIAALLTSAATPPTYDWKLTPAGWGPVRIGMTREQVTKTLKVDLQGDAFDNEGSCVNLYGADGVLPGLFFMFEDGKLTRISATGPSAVATPRGMHVGSTAEEVRKAYGSGLVTEPHKYEDAPAEYLTFWLRPSKSGVRFETDMQGKVEEIHAGNDSIQLVEGCH